MTAVDIETDISVLVGEMPTEPCEHSQHGTGNAIHDDGAATHYCESFCEGCHLEPVVIAACQAYTNWVLEDGKLYCAQCRKTAPASEFIRVLGPVGSL